jgi:hypothetical protein
MHTLEGAASSGIAELIKISDDSVQLVINDNRITGFHIIHDWYNSVDDIDYSFDTKLVSAAPNPIYNNSTEDVMLTFEVQKAGNVYIELFDILGNKILVIVDANYQAGRYKTSFNLRNLKTKLASGSYQIRMTTGMTVKSLPLNVIN